MKRKFWFGSIGLIIFLSIVLIGSWQLNRQSSIPTIELSNNQSMVNQLEPDLPTATSVSPMLAQAEPAIKLPQDSEFIVSGGSATATIRFIEGSIKPLDVHVGDTQNFRIVVTSPNGIKRVVAEIETDNGIFEVELTRQGLISIVDTYPNPYTVNPQDNTLKILNQDQLAQARFSEYQRELAQVKTGQANAAAGQPEVWTGSWVVKDVHARNYFTNFIAYDSAGNQEKLTMTWSDLCSIQLSGSWTSASTPEGCVIPAGYTDGVELGNVTIVSNRNLNLAAGATFVWNDGYKVIFSNGQLVLAANNQSKLKKGFLYVPDQDNDFYMPFGALAQQTTTAAFGYQRRYNRINTTTADCADNDNGVFPGNDIYRNTPISGKTGLDAWDSDCSGDISVATTASISASTIKDFTYFCNFESDPMAYGCNEPYAGGCAPVWWEYSYYSAPTCENLENPNLPPISRIITPPTFSKSILDWGGQSFARIAQAQGRQQCCHCLNPEGCRVFGCTDVNVNLNQISRLVSYQQCGQNLFPARIRDDAFYSGSGSTCNGSSQSLNSSLNQHFFATFGTTTQTFYCK